jgi:putative spermidine/putrescine transport system permease protein
VALNVADKPARQDSVWTRISAVMWRRPWTRATILLTPPLAWFLLIYIASLAVLLVTAFWTTNSYTGNLVRTWNLGNFTAVLTTSAYLQDIGRTLYTAAGVTLVDALIAFPFAYYMARVASRRTRTALYVAILLPLWASYLAKVYAWQLIFTRDGVLNWSLAKIALGPLNLINTNWAVFIAFCYIWLPYMVIPVYAALERIPSSMIEASHDLGGRTWRTTRSVILPLALPGIIAGSIFTFSLTLGDYITPELLGGTNSDFIGTVAYSSFLGNDVPLGAAMAIVPIAIMVCYLLTARALGAFEEL